MNTSKSDKSNFPPKQYERFPSIGPLNIPNLDDLLVLAKKDFLNRYKDNTVSDLCLSDFKIIKTLGSGSFGKVLLAELKRDKTLYAIKAVDKIKTVKHKNFRYVFNEKRILQSVNFPFVVCSKHFFVDFRYLYFAMMYVPGGDFSSFLDKRGPVDETSAQFYSSQLILAVEYLHYLDIIHRDLKPLNIMFDAVGYIKLCDFGTCVRCYSDGRCWTLVGTYFYLAPEIILEDGYTCSVDWWAIGVIIYEMCSNCLPFVHNNENILFERIVNIQYEIPKSFSPALKKLLQQIFIKEESNRIANKNKGAKDLKTHKWFKSIDWLQILNRTIEAPYKPGTKI